MWEWKLRIWTSKCALQNVQAMTIPTMKQNRNHSLLTILSLLFVLCQHCLLNISLKAGNTKGFIASSCIARRRACKVKCHSKNRLLNIPRSQRSISSNINWPSCQLYRLRESLHQHSRNYSLRRVEASPICAGLAKKQGLISVFGASISFIIKCQH